MHISICISIPMTLMALNKRSKSGCRRIPYETVCREVMGTKQRNQLRRLTGFRFRRHPEINLPEDRLTAIEDQINLRVRELLALPRK